MIKLVDTTIETVRRISHELRPGILDVLGLSVAIEWQAEEFQVETGVKCEFNMSAGEVSLDEECSTALFRIFQEALTNITRHANATRIFISFKEENGFVILKVHDNGVGITSGQISNSTSLGLMGMRERAMILGGNVTFEGALNQGTTVTVKMPVKVKETPPTKYPF